MTMNPLPPQAYTKDTMLRAYHWLQNQPASIRELALTPDILISLYLKASRDGEEALDRPSITNFKSELKNLAGMMGGLEREDSAEPSVLVRPSAIPRAKPPAPNSAAAAAVFAQQASAAKNSALFNVPPFSVTQQQQQPATRQTAAASTNSHVNVAPQPSVAKPVAQQASAPSNPEPQNGNSSFPNPGNADMDALLDSPLNPLIQKQNPTGSSPALWQGLDEMSVAMLCEIQREFNLSSPDEALRMLIKIGYSKARGFCTSKS